MPRVPVAAPSARRLGGRHRATPAARGHAGERPGSSEAERRRALTGRIAAHPRGDAWRTFLRQFKSPLVLILVFAALVSVATRDWVDAAIVLVIVLASATLGFQHEYRASRAIGELLARIAPSARVLRDGQPVIVPAEDVVPGDILVLAAGSLIPADARVMEAHDFFVNQAVLTGETFPVEKTPEPIDAAAAMAERTNVVFKGTNVAQRHGARGRVRHGGRRRSTAGSPTGSRCARRRPSSNAASAISGSC